MFQRLFLVFFFLLIAHVAHAQAVSCINPANGQPVVPFVPGCNLTLSWQINATNATGQQVWRRGPNVAAYDFTQPPFAGLGPTINSLVDATVVQGAAAQSYSYVITASNAAGRSAPSNEVTFVVPAGLPTAPTNATLK